MAPLAPAVSESRNGTPIEGEGTPLGGDGTPLEGDASYGPSNSPVSEIPPQQHGDGGLDPKRTVAQSERP